MKQPFLLVLATMICIPALAAEAQGLPSREPLAVVTHLSVKLNYVVYLPADYGKDPTKTWPLIIFLHGHTVADTPSGGLKREVIYPAMRKLWLTGRSRFIFVTPLWPSANGGWYPVLLNPFLDELETNYKIDADRIYLTGTSMGGSGTWNWAATNPERFAAIAPVAAGVRADPDFVATLKHMPVWAFHGEKDELVPIKYDQQLVAAVKQTGNPEVKFTQFPGAGHTCGGLVYTKAELYDWFLKFKRQPAAAGQAK